MVWLTDRLAIWDEAIEANGASLGGLARKRRHASTSIGRIDATGLSRLPCVRGRVGLVFELETQSRVLRRGVRAADSRVRFVACAGEHAPSRTGWAGGIVVDRRRCATLRIQVAGAAEPIERRVPLGKRCG